MDDYYNEQHWESYAESIEQGIDVRRHSGGSRSPRWEFKYDPNYYHVVVHFWSIQATTEKSYLLRVPYNMTHAVDVWVPKSICRDRDNFSKHVYGIIWRSIITKALQEVEQGIRKSFKKG